MQFMTSSSDRALMRADWRRFWPLLFGYAVVWLCVLPLGLWSRRGWSYDSKEALAVLENHNDYIWGCTGASVIISAVFAVILAMALYAYLMNGRSVGLMHALPVTRGRQFYAHFSVGVQIFTLVHAAVAAIALLVQAGLGAVDVRGTLEWAAVAELTSLFFFALATLCAMITGWLLAIPVIYAGVNFLFAVFHLLLSSVMQLFCWGCESNGWPVWLDWLTPGVRLFHVVSAGQQTLLAEQDSYRYYVTHLAAGAWVTLLVYTVLAIAFIAAAYFFYRARHSETAGDAVVFSWLRPVVLYVISLAGGMGFGILLWYMIDNANVSIVLLLACQVVAGLVTYFGMQMLLHKSFKVFTRRGWLGGALLAAALILIGFAVRFDFFGVVRYVPDAAAVESVTIRESSISVLGASEITDPETIEKATAVHRAILAQGEPQGDRMEEAWHSADAYPELYAVFSPTITYTMNNGTVVRRYYTTVVEKGTPLYEALDSLYNDTGFRTAAAETVYSWRDLADDAIVGGYLNDYRSDGESVNLTAGQARQLHQALKRYVTWKAQQPVDVMERLNTDWGGNYFYLELVAETNNSSGPSADYWNTDTLPADCTEVPQLLRSFGLLTDGSGVDSAVEDGAATTETSVVPATKEA